MPDLEPDTDSSPSELALQSQEKVWLSEANICKYDLDAVTILLLPSGRLALVDRIHQVREVRETLPSESEIRSYCHTWGLETHSIQMRRLKNNAALLELEPSDRELARDIKAANTPKKSPRKSGPQAVEIEL